MLNIAFDKARSFVSQPKLEYAIGEADEALNRIKEEQANGHEGLGWRRIAKGQDPELIRRIQNTAKDIRSDADVFILCGIGGSYLGARAIIDALSPYFEDQDAPEVLYAGHHLSGSYLDQLLRYLEQPKKDGSSKSVYVNVISKSGSTLETAVGFRVIKNWIHNQYDDAQNRILCTTSDQGGVLNDIIRQNGYRKFVIPNDIGGRLSVLTPVGLLPVAIAGFDIEELLEGARLEFEKNEEDPRVLLEYAALRRLLYEDFDKQLDLLTTFEPKLHSLTRWLQQLFGESEGKEGKGLFPATAVYSTDLHSLGQMVQEGERNLMETFITVDESLSETSVDPDPDVATLSYLDDKSFHELGVSAFEGTRDAHYEGEIPIFSLRLEKLNERALGHFIYFYELLTAVYGYTLGINPFNQPGVEQYKDNIYELLGKNKLSATDA
jgi:glucose-6-phosphate isomerase